MFNRGHLLAEEHHRLSWGSHQVLSNDIYSKFGNVILFPKPILVLLSSACNDLKRTISPGIVFLRLSKWFILLTLAIGYPEDIHSLGEGKSTASGKQRMVEGHS